MKEFEGEEKKKEPVGLMPSKSILFVTRNSLLKLTVSQSRRFYFRFRFRKNFDRKKTGTKELR